MTTNTHGVWNQIAGSWLQFRGEVRRRWGKLTNDDLEQIRGEHDVLIGKVQLRYGIAKAEAHKQVEEWVSKLH